MYPFPFVQLRKVKEGLCLLEPAQFLVVHGMPGSGKSVLAAEAVRDQDITLSVSDWN